MRNFYTSFFKRFFDFIFALLALVALSPVFVLVTIALFVANNGQPFFTQRRPGKDERIFKIIKFKTMNDKKDEGGQLLPDAQRLTGFGSMVRKTSLDEIPQLINVLKGDMSLIGPRPLLVRYLPLYNAEQRRRHEVRPGITGWAQVNGRNAISWEKKFELDVWYVDHVGLKVDVNILLRTIKKVFVREGISADGEATMKEFTGTNQV